MSEEAFPLSKAFAAVDGPIKSWGLRPYQHHVRHVRDHGDKGQEFLAIFSIPEPTLPVTKVVASATFMVRAPRDAGDPPKVTYTIEAQRAKLPIDRPIRRAWLDAAIKRKRSIQEVRASFKKEGRLPQPLAFVPGKYKAAQALDDAKFDGMDENEERLMEASMEYEEAHMAAVANALESDAELEQLLVSIFNDGDSDGNGHLDAKEFRALLSTAQLDLDESEVRQLLVLADANGDGKIEYAEFAPLGADIIQTMRLRKLNQAEQALAEEEAELNARELIHGLGEEVIVKTCLAAFREFDTDNSGRLERAEIEECLKALTLGATKLTPREIKMVLAYIDEDESGTVEYNEFAPLMFNCLVEALKMGFLESEMDDVSLYLTQHLGSYTDEDGRLSVKTLKAALMDADLIALTPIQMQTVLADAPVDKEDKVKIAQFVPAAARMIWKLTDPMLEAKRVKVTKMAKVTPLQALTPEEVERLKSLAQTVFTEFDADKSGKLDRAEFHKCLTESKMGLSERQIQHLMMAADEDEDGTIDYNEFADLFYNCLMEMSRQMAIDRMMEQDFIQGVKQSLEAFLDELMIPLHLAFDIASAGQDTCAVEAVVDILWSKSKEWSVMPEAVKILAAGVTEQPKPALSWDDLVAIIEKVVMEPPPEAAETGAPAAA